MVLGPCDRFRHENRAVSLVGPLPVTAIAHSPWDDGNGSGCEVWTTIVNVRPVEVRVVPDGVAPFTMSASPLRSMNENEN